VIDFTFQLSGFNKFFVSIGIKHTYGGSYIVLKILAVFTKIMQEAKEFAIICTADFLSVLAA